MVPARPPDPAPAVEIAAEPLPAPAAMPQPEVAAAQPPPMLEERAAPAVAPNPAPEFAPPPAPAPPVALPAPMLAEPPALPVPDGADLPAADAPEITLPPPAPEPPALDAPALPLMAEAPAPPLPAPLAQPEAALPSPALEMRAPNAAPIPEPAADPEALESLLAAKPLEPSALLPAPAEVAALPPVAIAPPDQRTPRLPAPPPATAAAPIAALPEAESGAAAAAGALPDSPVAAPPPIPVAPGLSLESRPQALDPLALRREPNREQIIEQLGGSQDTERAIGKALDWFTRHQEADGRWDIARHGGKRDHDIAATGMALLCYMGWGSTHTGGGPHAEPLRKGIAWLAAQIGEGGELGGDRQTKGNMSDQGIATIALAEAYALTGDESLRPKVEAAAGFILRAQNGTGSWRYAMRRPGRRHLDPRLAGPRLKNAAMPASRCRPRHSRTAPAGSTAAAAGKRWSLWIPGPQPEARLDRRRHVLPPAPRHAPHPAQHARIRRRDRRAIAGQRNARLLPALLRHPRPLPARRHRVGCLERCPQTRPPRTPDQKRRERRKLEPRRSLRQRSRPPRHHRLRRPLARGLLPVSADVFAVGGTISQSRRDQIQYGASLNGAGDGRASLNFIRQRHRLPALALGFHPAAYRKYTALTW
ncbi:MAG: hypothetical protein R3F11_01370 [Verrucomicrobiales bacterium]